MQALEQQLFIKPEPTTTVRKKSGTTSLSETERRMLDLAHALRNGVETMKDTIAGTASDLGAIQILNLRTIIDALCRTALKKGYILAEEFIDEFHNGGIAKSIVAQFIERFKGAQNGAKLDELEMAEARSELLDFISGYAQDNGRSLNMFIDNLKLDYPGINLYELFSGDPQIAENLAGQINIAAEDIARDTYPALFDKDPEGFILDVLVNGVTFTKEDYIEINRERLRELIRFLCDKGYPLEELHRLFYTQIVEMRKTRKDAQTTKREVRSLFRASQVLAKYPLLDEGIDYDERIWKKEFLPMIVEARRSKLPDKVGLIDSLRTRVGDVVVPPEICEPVKKRVTEMLQDQDEYIVELRRILDIPDKTERPGSKIVALSDEEVLRMSETLLNETGELMKAMVGTALERRKDNDPIRRDCLFLPEIIDCNDYRELAGWVVRPLRFYKKYPQYRRYNPGHVAPAIISHFARKKLEFMEKNRSCIHAMQSALEERDLAVEFLSLGTELNLKKTKPERTEIQFRIRAEVDPVTQKKILKDGGYGDDTELPTDSYEVMHDEKHFQQEPDASVIMYDKQTQKWKLNYPKEVKKFWEAEVTLPGGETIKLLVYGGDGELIHVKSKQSYIESDLRGGNPENDKLRLTFVTNNLTHRDKLRGFLQDRYNAKFVSLRDTCDGRSINKGSRPKSDTSQGFSEKREFIGTVMLKIPIGIDTNGQIIHREVTVEMQIQSLDNMLITNCSDYTPSSHRRTYKPERVFNNILFKHLFPPALFGAKYAQHRNDGYRKL